MDCEEAEACRVHLKQLSLLLSAYKWLLDSFIIEFFVEKHWNQLPSNWQDTLRASDNGTLSEIAGLIFADQDVTPPKRVFPLSLLSFAATCRSLSFTGSLSKRPHGAAAGDGDPLPSPPSSALGQPPVDGLGHSFRRHVKPKKQHEVKCLGKVVAELCRQTDCRNVADIGSGQGHLARYLAFHHDLRVTAVEAVGSHLTTASKFDRKVQTDLDKQRARGKENLGVTGEGRGQGTLRHLEATIQPDTTAAQLLSQIRPMDAPPTGPTSSFADEVTELEKGEELVLTGLHPCGDLSATILRAFAHSRQIVGVACVGCCYMKLTTGPSPLPGSRADPEGRCGYPMSQFLKGCGHTLSYEARELACHSIASYCDRFKEVGDFDHLKVHSHRAAVEVLLRKNGLRRSQVRIAKRVSGLPFQRYAQELLESVQRVGPQPQLSWSQGELSELEEVVESEWRNVVVFFLLRLALAPAVEAMILLDRKLYLLEQGCRQVDLFPVFDQRISPRNVALLAR